MNIVEKFRIAASILISSTFANASDAVASEYFCHNNDGWVRLIIESDHGKFSHGKFDVPTFETFVPMEALTTINREGKMVSVVNHHSELHADPTFYLYAELTEEIGKSFIRLHFQYENASEVSFNGELSCKLFE
jgi:hypothetical protein